MDLRKLKDRATQEMAKHKFAKAAATYAELIEADPRDLQLRQKRGDALRAANHDEEAMQVYIHLADAYAKDGQLLKAIAVNKIVLELDPQHTQTQQRLAALYSRRTVVKSGAFVPIPLVNAVTPEEAPEPEAAPEPTGDDVAMDDFLGAAATPDSEMADFLSLEAPTPEAGTGEEQPASEAGVDALPAPEADESQADAAFDESLEEAFRDEPLDAPLDAPLEPAGAAAPPNEQLDAPEEEPASPILELALDVEGDEPLLLGDEIVFEDDFDLHALEPEMAETLDKLPESPLFEGLDQPAFMELVKRCERRAFAAGDVLVQQGDEARSFFVLNQGELMVVRLPEAEGQQPLELARLRAGDFFGELALVSGSPRSASVVAVTEGDALEFSGVVLRELVENHPEAAAALNRFTRARLLQNTMATSPLFRPFDRAQRKLLIARFMIRDVEAESSVVTQGQPSDGLYVVMLGQFRVERDGQAIAQLGAGDIFGEISLLSRSKATASVISEGPGRLLRLPRKIFDELILTHPQVLELVATLADERQSRNAELTGRKVAPDRDGLILV